MTFHIKDKALDPNCIIFWKCYGKRYLYFNTQQGNTSLEQPMQGQRKERSKVFQNYNKF